MPPSLVFARAMVESMTSFVCSTYYQKCNERTSWRIDLRSQNKYSSGCLLKDVDDRIGNGDGGSLKCSDEKREANKDVCAMDRN